VGTVAALTRAVERRDPYARGHADRVTELAVAIGRRLEVVGERLEELRLGARLHDVGKLAVAHGVLLKPGALTTSELVQIRAHPRVGARLVGASDDLRGALPYVLYHHERWDGGGYPEGHAGAAIPLGARILAVADAFDAMTCDRPYRRARPVGHALAELFRCAGSQFDPEVVGAFLEAWEAGEIETLVPAAAAAS
jgi:HD-GYP domain-containing protein (c-di-GMP phosphodiesterase class II)